MRSLCCRTGNPHEQVHQTEILGLLKETHGKSGFRGCSEATSFGCFPSIVSGDVQNSLLKANWGSSSGSYLYHKHACHLHGLQHQHFEFQGQAHPRPDRLQQRRQESYAGSHEWRPEAAKHCHCHYYYRQTKASTMLRHGARSEHLDVALHFVQHHAKQRAEQPVTIFEE